MDQKVGGLSNCPSLPYIFKDFETHLIRVVDNSEANSIWLRRLLYHDSSSRDASVYINFILTDQNSWISSTRIQWNFDRSERDDSMDVKLLWNSLMWCKNRPSYQHHLFCSNHTTQNKPTHTDYSPAGTQRTTLYGRWNDVKTLKRRLYNVVLTSCVGWDNYTECLFLGPLFIRYYFNTLVLFLYLLIRNSYTGWPI